MTVQVNVPNVPPKIAAALTKDARKQKQSVNDTAVSIVASALGFPGNGDARPFADVNAEWLPLRMDEELRRRLRVHAAMKDLTIRGAVIQILGEHYKLPT